MTCKSLLTLRPHHVFWNARFLFDRLMGRKVILLLSSTGHGFDYLLPIYKELSTRHEIRAYWILANKSECQQDYRNRVGTAEMLAAVKQHKIPRSRVAQIGRFAIIGDFCITAHLGGEPFPINRKIPTAYVPHGVVNKVIEDLPDISLCRILFSPGPMYDEIASTFHTRGQALWDIWHIGYPKIDEVIVKSAARNSHRGKQTPTVLFAPTWNKHAALDVYGLAPVDALLEAGLNVIVKLHPISLGKHPVNRRDWKNELTRYQGNPRVTIVGSENANPWFLKADVMVSDVSGVAYEFLATDKPVVFLDLPPHFFNDPSYPQRLHDVSYWGRSAGIIVNDMENLVRAVKRSIEFPMEKAEERRKLREKLFYNPGTASQAAVEHILRYLQSK